MSEPENPAAFPHVEPRDPQFSTTEPGMTLRDWFAGQVIASLPGFPVSDEECAHRARVAYQQARHMLAARQQEAQS